jgi:IclR family acetate operon transcriptional repressor
VERAIDLLKAVAEAHGPQASVAELAKRCGLNRATAWRLLTTLEAQQMVRRDGRNGWYVLGCAVAELQTHVAHEGVVERARPVLERLSLETGEITCLGVVDQGRLVYGAEVIPAIVDSCSWLGEPIVYHASSLGKAFLASLDDAEVRALVGPALTRYTDTTITDLEDLLAELRYTRALGYSVCRGELESGSWGVAAPVVGPDGDADAFVCIWGPDRRGDNARLAALGRLALRAARDVATR